MNRFWDMLPRAIRFKWKTAVKPTLGRFRGATDQQRDINEEQLLSSPTVANEPPQLETQKTNSLAICVPKLFTSTHKQSWGHDPNFCRWPFSLSRTFGFLGWGTVLAFGLQINKYRWKLKNNSSNSENSWREYVAYALPLNRSAILDFDSKPSHNSYSDFKPDEFPQKKSDPDTLDDKLASVVEKCVAIGQNIEGITAANGGDFQAAVNHWKKSSDLGHSKSNFNLGLCYETGKGVKKDLTKAMKYYQAAADKDHLQAMYNLALIHLNSQNATKNSEFIMAINLLERAAKLGLPQAQTQLGVFYAEGEQNDFSKAIEMFTAAAQKQDTEALYYLGICFEGGFGVNQNESKAAEFFIKAANNGHSEAQYCLANYYEQGLGDLPRDEKFAEDLYMKSAKAGNENSKERLREILHDESSRKAEVLKTSCSVPVLNSIEKVSQVATIFTNSISSMLTNSVMALKSTACNNNNNNNSSSRGGSDVNFYMNDNIRDIEEQLDNHLQYMPHCGIKHDFPLPSSEVLCS